MNIVKDAVNTGAMQDDSVRPSKIRLWSFGLLICGWGFGGFIFWTWDEFWGRIVTDSLNTLHAVVFPTRKVRNLFGANCECNNNAVVEVNDSCVLIIKIDSSVFNCPNMPMVVGPLQVNLIISSCFVPGFSFIRAHTCAYLSVQIISVLML